MSDAATSTFSRASGILAAEQGGHTILLDPKGERYFGCDGVGAHIWELLATPRSVPQLVDSLAAAYDEPRGRIEADVGAFIGELEAAHLVVRRPSGPDRPR